MKIYAAVLFVMATLACGVLLVEIWHASSRIDELHGQFVDLSKSVDASLQRQAIELKDTELAQLEGDYTEHLETIRMEVASRMRALEEAHGIAIKELDTERKRFHDAVTRFEQRLATLRE